MILGSAGRPSSCPHRVRIAHSEPTYPNANFFAIRMCEFFRILKSLVFPLPSGQDRHCDTSSLLCAIIFAHNREPLKRARMRVDGGGKPGLEGDDPCWGGQGQGEGSLKFEVGRGIKDRGYKLDVLRREAGDDVSSKGFWPVRYKPVALTISLSALDL